MDINGKTKVCGLIGNPVEHTLSPLIHNMLAEKMGHDMVYVPFEVENGSIKEAVQGAFALNLLGMNVTVPYKSKVIPFLESADALAAKIGAVNTLVRGEKGYIGYNTDIEGLYLAMQSEGIRIEGEEILLLGAGGAARAVAFLCADKGAKTVTILNRSADKAMELAAEINRTLGMNCVKGIPMADYEKLPQKKFLAIQGTSVGLHPDSEHAVIEEKAFYSRIHTGYDLIYKPETTRFMELVREAGGKACNGLKMLLYQGIIAYQLWNRVTISEADTEFIYKKLKEACRIDE